MLFATVFVVKLTVAPNRLHFVRTHPLEALMVLLPFLRPLRVLRLLKLARVATALGVNTRVMQRLASRRGMQTVAATVILIAVAGALLGMLFERGEAGANITSFESGLWWSIVTMTTVGYGDYYPVTAAGRGVALALMLLGIAALSVVTASIAAFIVREDEEPAGRRSQYDTELLLERIDRLERKIDELSERGR
ncbi:MAG: ion channel [Dehalococcoidia bacterium]|nr:ion channel [Dehalococcoidia bacterium]